MKKSLIAGAGVAAFAFAAFPFALASATPQTATPVKDTLNVTLEKTCNISRTGTAATVAAPISAASWSNATGTNDGTYTVSLAAGSTAALGTSKIKVTCNDTKDGHSLSVATTNLTAPASSTGLSGDTVINYSNSEVGTSTSGWNITTAANTDLSISAGVVQVTSNAGTVYNTNKTAVSESEIDLTYNIGTTPVQATGTYVGDATYTLTFGS